jgi:hypothetical protein
MGRLSKAKPHQLRNVSLGSLLASRSRGLHPPFVGTKIVATLGPSCCDVPTLVHMLEAGMSVARIDLTWGPIAFHRRSLDNLQQAMRASRRLCGVMVRRRRQAGWEGGSSGVWWRSAPAWAATLTVPSRLPRRGPQVDTLGRELMIKRRFVLGADGWVGGGRAGWRGLAHVAGGCGLHLRLPWHLAGGDRCPAAVLR